MRLASATTVLPLALALGALVAGCEAPQYPPQSDRAAARPLTGVATAPPAPEARQGVAQAGDGSSLGSFKVIRGRSPSAVQPPAVTPTTTRERRARDAAAAVRPVFRLGSGRFLNNALYSRGMQGSAAPDLLDEEGVILNFANADIREVVRAILGDILQLNYTVAPEVSGQVTLQSSSPLATSDLIPTLESLLRLNGAALVVEGGLYKVIAFEGTAGQPAPLYLTPGGIKALPGYGVEAIPLRFVAAREMAKILEPFAAEGSILSVDASRNLLLVSGTPEERAALVAAVEVFDVNWLSGTSFGVFPLENARAETMAQELGIIFGSAQNESLQDIIRFVPVERLNAVLVISLQPRYLQEAREWIAELDKSAGGATPRVFVRFIENQRASELAEVLGQVFGAQTRTVASRALTPDLEPASLAPGIPGEGEGISTTPSGSLALPPPSDGILVRGEKDIRIIAVDATNSLVVLATPQDYRMVEDAIDQLDVLPLQVLIEATILEVTLNDDLEFGVQWFFDSGQSEFRLSEFADGGVSRVFPGFSYIFQEAPDVRFVVNALSEITDVNVVSSPQLLVLDNQSAELQVGDEVPIATQQAVSVTDPEAPIVNSIEFRDTGVILRVTPRVNKGGLVVLEIEQEVSSVVATTTSGIDSPTIRQRRITSSVAIQGGETVALGGLIREEATRGSSGIPYLSDIPVLGFLFGSRINDQDRTELLVLITPRVVRNQRDARDVTNELRRRMQTIEPLPLRIE